MTAVAIDTLKVAQKLQDSGFTRKQATGVAEVLADVVADRPSKDAVIESVETLGRAVDKRFTEVDKRFTAVDKRFTAVDKRLASLEDSQSRIETLLAKVLEGQAVLHQNDMELKRRLDERK